MVNLNNKPREFVIQTGTAGARHIKGAIKGAIEGDIDSPMFKIIKRLIIIYNKEFINYNKYLKIAKLIETCQKENLNLAEKLIEKYEALDIQK